MSTQNTITAEIVDRYPSGRCALVTASGFMGLAFRESDVVGAYLTLDELEDLHEQIGGAIAELQGQIDERDPDEYRDNRIEEWMGR